MTEKRLVAWLEQVNEQYEVRVSVKEGNEWVDRRSLIENVDEIQTDSTPSREESRYYLRTRDQNPVIEEWIRYAFPIKGGDGDELDTEEQMEIVLELPVTMINIGVPWDRAETMALSSEYLRVDHEDAFSPVAADRVAGLAKEKERLTRFLDTDNRDWGLVEETGIILEGPPGTGKTELVIELCQETYGSMPVMISGPEILSKWVGESERMLRKKFAEARNADQEQPVLYIDELDAIARTRSETSEDYSAQIVAQLLVLLDGVEAKQEDEQGNPLKVIASTNLSHVVDPALRRPGRLGSRPIQFERPVRLEREAILHHYLEQIRRSSTGELSEDLHDFVTGDTRDALDEIVTETEGFTGADLEDLIQEAVSQLKKEGRTTLTTTFLQNVLEENFDPADTIRSETITEGIGEAVEAFDGNLEQRVYALGDCFEARDVATAYFDQLATSTDHDQEFTFKYREITPTDILEEDPVRAKENVIEAFHHAENERICLYIRDTEEFVQARENSSLIDQLAGVINENILQWNRDNLVILNPVPEKYSKITVIGEST